MVLIASRPLSWEEGVCVRGGGGEEKSEIKGAAVLQTSTAI